MAFCEEHCLPAAERGPEERSELAARERAGWRIGLGIRSSLSSLSSRTSDAVLAWAGGDYARRVVDVVGWGGED
jgi:hypothetical protein